MLLSKVLKNIMRKIDFLSKLNREGKLELVEPSEEMKQSYIVKSESNIISAKILLDNNRLEESVGLAYYSMYHMLTALLFGTGIKSENHAASIILLKALFYQENKEIFDAKAERVDKQYYVDFVITREDAQETIKKAESFNNSMIDFISRLNNDAIQLYRKRFVEIV